MTLNEFKIAVEDLIMAHGLTPNDIDFAPASWLYVHIDCSEIQFSKLEVLIKNIAKSEYKKVDIVNNQGIYFPLLLIKRTKLYK